MQHLTECFYSSVSAIVDFPCTCRCGGNDSRLQELGAIILKSVLRIETLMFSLI